MNKYTKRLQPYKWAMGLGAKTEDDYEPPHHPDCMDCQDSVSHPCEDCEKKYTITEALTIVRDAALEGRKLEAWCDGDPDCSIGYVEIGGEFKWMWRVLNSGFVFKVDVFDMGEVFDSWHVREVQDG